MIHGEHSLSLLVLLAGLLLVASLLVRAGLRRLQVPGLVGFLALGFLLRLADGWWPVLSGEATAVFDFLAKIGVVVLLFRIGLESNLRGLARQLPRAGPIWAGNVLLSGVAGYATAHWLLGFERIPSLFAAVAFTATSVGVSMALWRRKDALDSPSGELLVDVAELDDLSGVGLMAVLFALVPMLRDPGASATTLIIAAIAGWLGFSLAIGALFAGLLFSRDPDAIKFDASFESIYELFMPFFFIGIGLGMAPASLPRGLGLGAVLLAAAAAAKLAGAGAPALLSTGRRGALLIGLSMIPRAEITMIIMQRGRQLGDWAVPPRLYSGMVVVCAATCVVIPLLLDQLLDRRQQD